MYSIDMIQIIQLVFALFVIVNITCFFCILFKKPNFNRERIRLTSHPKLSIKYNINLKISDFESYHKYHIWRYYRFT